MARIKSRSYRGKKKKKQQQMAAAAAVSPPSGSLRWALKPQGISKTKAKSSTSIKTVNDIIADNTDKDNIVKTQKESLEEDSTEHFRFLDLPVELRDQIYKAVSESEPAYLSKHFRGYMITKNALARVSRGIRDEFISAAYIYSTEIRAVVIDFDFRHIVTFLNRLSDREMKELLEGPSSREMKIELTFTRNWARRDSALLPLDLLKRWINRTVHPAKKGTKIVTSYEVVAHEIPHSRAYICATMRRVPCHNELNKIIDAIKNGPGL